LEALSGDRSGQHSIRINDLVNGRRGMTPSTALRLARYFGNTPAFWMNLPLRWDLFFAMQEESRMLEHIQPHQHSLAGN
jgi:plasmid maintenance system antidote protein VapI